MQLMQRGMSHKLFDIMKRFSNEANCILSSPPTVIQVEALIKNENDCQEIKDSKAQFLSALHKYGIVRNDGTLDLTIRPAFLKPVVF